MMHRKSGRLLPAVVVRLLVAFVLLATASPLRAATATWDPPVGSDVAGYVLLYGTQSHVYSTTMDVGNVTAAEVSLTPGRRYYFAVQAYNSAGQLSQVSAEAIFDAPADTAPPTITSLTPTSGPVGTSSKNSPFFPIP